MPASNGEKTAIVLKCSDPRLEGAAPRLNDRIKEMLGVEFLIPITHPGVVGIHRAKGFGTPMHLRREGVLHALGIHIELHKPKAIVVVSHHDCLGCPGDPEEQEQHALVAAGWWGDTVRNRFGFTGTVHPAVFELHPNPGWDVKFLD